MVSIMTFGATLEQSHSPDQRDKYQPRPSESSPPGERDLDSRWQSTQALLVLDIFHRSTSINIRQETVTITNGRNIPSPPQGGVGLSVKSDTGQWPR